MTSSDSRKVPGLRTGATGLLESGEAIDARKHAQPADVAEPKETLGRRSRERSRSRFFAHWLPEMDAFVRLNYRETLKDKTLAKGIPAKQIAEYLSKKYNQPLTANSIVSRFHRKIKHGPRDPASRAVPQKATRTPSLPKLKFLGDEQ